MPTDRLARGPRGVGIAWQARRPSYGGCDGVRGAERLPANPPKDTRSSILAPGECAYSVIFKD